MNGCSHWGLWGDELDEAGRYELQTAPAPQPGQPGVVLTTAGEVLIHRDCTFRPAGCTVAVIIDRDHVALTRPQIERMLRTWDIACTVAEGNEDAVTLLPVPHHWRFPRADYLTLDEWQEQKGR